MPKQIPCKVCGSDSKYTLSLNNEHGLPRLLDLYLCNKCGLLFVGNPITHKQLAYAYETLNTDEYYEEIATPTTRKAVRSVNDVLPLLDNCCENPSVLDVGCGYGHFLGALRGRRPSIEMFGQELPGASASTMKKRGFRVYECTLEDIDENFSLVTLLDVAEHVPQPNDTFAAFSRLVKRGGHVYIHTPRRCFWDSLFLVMAKIPGLRECSKIWLRSRVSIFHLQLWTDKALYLSLRRAGFKVVKLEKELELSWPLERYAKVYLREKLHAPSMLVKLSAIIAQVLFVQLRLLRNKAILLARKEEGPNGI